MKAERHVDDEASIEDLQKKTVKHIRQEHHQEEQANPDQSKDRKSSQRVMYAAANALEGDPNHCIMQMAMLQGGCTGSM